MNTSSLLYERKGQLTLVTLDGRLIGTIKRHIGSNTSVRGGAYRTFHTPTLPTGVRMNACYSRKEAAEDLLRAHLRSESEAQA